MRATFSLPVFGAMTRTFEGKAVTSSGIIPPENGEIFFGKQSGSALRAMALAGLVALAPMATNATASAGETQDSTQTEIVQAQGAEALTPENFAEKTRGLPSQVLLYRGRADNKPLMDFLADLPELKGKMNFFVYSLEQPNAMTLDLKDEMGMEVYLPPTFINEALIMMNSRGELAYVLLSTEKEGIPPSIDPYDEATIQLLVGELERQARILTIPENPEAER